MTFSEFLSQNSASFVKPTANLNGLNFRNAENRVVATVLVENCPQSETEIFQWIKERMNYTVSVNAGNSIIRLNAPVDKGFSLNSLFATPAKSKSSRKVKA